MCRLYSSHHLLICYTYNYWTYTHAVSLYHYVSEILWSVCRFIHQRWQGFRVNFDWQLLSRIEVRGSLLGGSGVPWQRFRWHPDTRDEVSILSNLNLKRWRKMDVRNYGRGVKEMGQRINSGYRMLRETHKGSEGVEKKAKEGERQIKAAEQEIGSSRFSRHKKTPTHSHLSLHLRLWRREEMER